MLRIFINFIKSSINPTLILFITTYHSLCSSYRLRISKIALMKQKLSAQIRQLNNIGVSNYYIALIFSSNIQHRNVFKQLTSYCTRTYLEDLSFFKSIVLLLSYTFLNLANLLYLFRIALLFIITDCQLQTIVIEESSYRFVLMCDCFGCFLGNYTADYRSNWGKLTLP